MQKMNMSWTTRVPPERTQPFGVAELHVVYFVPDDWLGAGPVIGLQIPECKMQCVALAPDGTPLVMVNEPQQNKKVKHWLRTACEMVAEQKACLILSCDTNEQAERAAKTATRLLPKHRRAAMERMEEPAARMRSGLN
jgi:hypothetical protein